MPASRNTPPVPGPAVDLLDALWTSVAASRDRTVAPEELERVATEVSVLARQAGLLPEHLVVGVKDSWSACAALRARADRPMLESVLRDVVARVIRAYFAVAAAPEAGAPTLARRGSGSPHGSV